MTDLEAAAAVYARTRDPDLRARIVLGYQPLARRCALNMRRHHEPIPDLIQVANVALLEALDRYQPTAGTFETYARATIRGALRHHYRTVWRVHVPRNAQENFLRYHRVVGQLTAQLGRTATIPEIAHAAGLTVDETIEAAYVGFAMYTDPLTWLNTVDEHDGDPEMQLQITVEDPPAEAGIDLHLMLARLTPLQRRCIYLRYWEDLTTTAIGEQLGITQTLAFKALTRGLDRLRAMAQAQEAAA